MSDFHYVDKQHKLALGALQGNRFSILLRFITADDHCITHNIQQLLNNGFINYFGLQRFGSTNVPTHQVGKAIISRQFQQAFHLILSAQDKYTDI